MSFFLAGVWKGKGRVVDAQKDFEYAEEVSITHQKGPIYLYLQKTLKLPENTPLHQETGYLRVFPDATDPSQGKAELCLAQPFGVCEIEQGAFKDNRVELSIDKSTIIRSQTAKEPFVTGLVRTLWLDADKPTILHYTMSLGSTTHDLRPHLEAYLEKQEK